MKPVENRPVIISRIKIVDPDPDTYWCINCREINSGRVRFRETGYGEAALISLDGDLENQETDDYDNFEIIEYFCIECEHRADSIQDIFTNENPEEEDEEDEDEEE